MAPMRPDAARARAEAAGPDRDEQVQIRCALADAWLLQDDIRQATEALGPPPEGRERLDPARLSDLWRMHGRLAIANGEPSRGIALLTKALKQAERAHDSRAIGLAHYELGLCYRQVGDIAIVREHISKAASALHAAGDRRHLAMVHSLSGVTLAQEGRLDEAMTALRHAERLAVIVEAGDVLATVCGNQANVALMQHRHDQALALAERSVELQEQAGTPHGLGVALASLGQICVRLGNLTRAEEALNRALDVRSPLQFMRETTGAVFDTLAQIHLIRGQHDAASRSPGQGARSVRRIRLADSRWYQWSVARARGARSRCGAAMPARALHVASDVARSADAPPGYALQAELIAVEALPGARPARRGAAAARRGLARASADGDERHVGRVPAPARPAPSRSPAARPRRTTTSGRASACSSCSASATRRRSATSSSGASRRRPVRDRARRAT